jgi:hypothetical protein
MLLMRSDIILANMPQLKSIKHEQFAQELVTARRTGATNGQIGIER